MIGLTPSSQISNATGRVIDAMPRDSRLGRLTSIARRLGRRMDQAVRVNRPYLRAPIDDRVTGRPPIPRPSINSLLSARTLNAFVLCKVSENFAPPLP